ncbi:histidine phosphatase family protein [Microbacterium imperiale]|uniref:Phosphatase PhoE n=1 Tax=Microbacterium imperiale TaxID=33884 RepID=A0A9W6HFR2_9MICO|nr:histidine phosphatase family protein [Microbacterium imperiale]MBP2419428.1 putative phosphoglycerate mutase [Microbacterium imperiale]MDS0198702.1 histidine phosphatase family protein [Microbacterium imperiale]BFE39770.1 phosphatase PhoE [Microbacterium imperiale]GLJ79255.1 putative phosphatase PhoE [Microbacterium imperiale]
MTVLTLVRHGETDWNRDRRIQGSTDIPLNDTGRAQARAVGVELAAKLSGVPGVTVASSDLARAAETARLIAAELDAPDPLAYPELRERGYGDAEGVGVEEFHARWGEWATAEVPNAEPWPTVRERALRGLERAVRDARTRTAPVAAPLIVVAHGALIREVIRHATADEFPLQGVRLANGSSHTFLFERERLRLLESAAVASG